MWGQVVVCMGILEEIRVEGFLKSCLPDNYGSHGELVVKREKGISGYWIPTIPLSIGLRKPSKR